MSKLLDETGVAWIFNKIKSVFLTIEDAESVDLIETQPVDAIEVDSIPTQSSTNLVESGGVYTAINNIETSLKVHISTTQPVNGMLPNTLYNFGTITTDITFTLDSATDNTIVNIWHWVFSTGSSIPNITWPVSGINVWIDGEEPDIESNTYYEISVMNGVAVVSSVEIPSS